MFTLLQEVGVVLPPMRTSDDGAEDFSCTETEFDDDLDQEKMRENDRWDIFKCVHNLMISYCLFVSCWNFNSS